MHLLVFVVLAPSCLMSDGNCSTHKLPWTWWLKWRSSNMRSFHMDDGLFADSLKLEQQAAEKNPL